MSRCILRSECYNSSTLYVKCSVPASPITPCAPFTWTDRWILVKDWFVLRYQNRTRKTSIYFTRARGPRPPHYQGFTITLRHTTLGRTPLDKLPAPRWNLYLRQHSQETKTHASGGIRPSKPSKRTHTFDSAAIGIGKYMIICEKNTKLLSIIPNGKDSLLIAKFRKTLKCMKLPVTGTLVPVTTALHLQSWHAQFECRPHPLSVPFDTLYSVHFH